MAERTPGAPLERSARQMVFDANERIETLSADAAHALLDDPRVLFVDVRDVRELDREGMIPGAFHAPRGMLEFWVDPDSPYYNPTLDDGRHLVLYGGTA